MLCFNTGIKKSDFLTVPHDSKKPDTLSPEKNGQSRKRNTRCTFRVRAEHEKHASHDMS